jgi:hypothetical protein
MKRNNDAIIALVAILFGIFLLASSCRGADEFIEPQYIEALRQRREDIKQWACLCPPGSFEGTYSTMDGICHQGDMVCFAGLSCLAARLAGDDEYADARAEDVLRAQSWTGRWHRGPMWVDTEYAPNDPSAADFSRDQTRGVFAYLLADGYISQDQGKYARAVLAAEKWIGWMEDHGNRHCLDDSRTCEWTTGTYNTAYNVYRLLGVIPRPESPMARRMYRSRWYYGLPLLANIRLLYFDEITRDKWYPRHLKWWTNFFYRVRNMDPVTREVKSRHWARVWGKAARRLWAGDPVNPLYRLGYEGVTRDLVTEVMMKFTKSTMPTPELNYRDWAWQRHTSEEAWLRSDGHDQILLINLILAKVQGHLNW